MALAAISLANGERVQHSSGSGYFAAGAVSKRTTALPKNGVPGERSLCSLGCNAGVKAQPQRLNCLSTPYSLSF